MEILKLLLLGLVSGLSSGILGLGGGLVMIPAMTLLMGYHQKMAQGTSLAVMVLPIGVLGAWRYFQEGNVKLQAVLWIALSFVVGAYFGADLVQGLSNLTVKRLFGGVMLLLSLKMLWGK